MTDILSCHSCILALRSSEIEYASGHCPRCGGILRSDPIPSRELRAAGRRRRKARVKFSRELPEIEIVRTGKLGKRSAPKIKAAKRERIYARDGYACLRCGEMRRRKLSIDHIVKWADGGSNRDDNLRTLCRKCNSSRDTWELTEGQLAA